MIREHPNVSDPSTAVCSLKMQQHVTMTSEHHCELGAGHRQGTPVSRHAHNSSTHVIFAAGMYQAPLQSACVTEISINLMPALQSSSSRDAAPCQVGMYM